MGGQRLPCHASTCPAKGPVCSQLGDNIWTKAPRDQSLGGQSCSGSLPSRSAPAFNTSWILEELGCCGGLLIAQPTKGSQPQLGQTLCKYCGFAKSDQLSIMCAQSCPDSPKPGYEQALSQTKVTQCLQSDLPWPSELVSGIMPPFSLRSQG